MNIPFSPALRAPQSDSAGLAQKINFRFLPLLFCSLVFTNSAGAVDVDTTPGITVTAPTNLGAGLGTLNVTGAGTVTINGAGLVALGSNTGGSDIVNINMTGGLIDIQTGVKVQNGGWQSGVWTNNKASMNIASGATLDVWDGNAVFIDALTGAGSVIIGDDLGAGWAGARSITLGVNGGSGTFTGSFANPGGSLNLTKAGSGTQTLSGAANYSGGTTVNGGRLVLVNTGTGSNNFVTNANLEFNVGTGVTVQRAGGTISGTGNLIKSGAGYMWLGANGQPQTVSLTGASSVIDVQGGVLRNEYGNSAWGGNKASLNVASGAYFDVWDGDVTVDFLSGSGTINKAWSGTNKLTFGVNNGSGSFTGTISSSTGYGYGGNAGGTFNLEKVGTGTQVISGSAAYEGGATVAGGTLRLVDLVSFSSGTGAANTLSIASGATLEFNLSSSTSFTTDGANQGLGKTGGTTVNGAGTFLKTGPGVLALGGQGGNGSTVTMDMTGGTIDIQGGTLRNGGWAGGIWTNNKSSMNLAAGGSFDLWDGNDVFIDALTGSGTINKGQTAGSPRKLILGVNNGSGVFSGTIQNTNTGGGGVAIVKNGTGTQTFTGPTSYSGGTTVNGGRLIIQNSGTGSGNFVVDADLEFNVTTGTAQTAGGTISGTGNIIKTGSGQLWFGANGQPETVALTGANSEIQVQGGVLRNEYLNSAWGGNKAGLRVSAGAVFDLWDGDATVDEVNGAGTINKAYSGTHTLTIGSNNGSGSFSGTISTVNTLGFGGVGGGVLNLTKVGSGVQTLSGTSSVNGTMTVSGGTLIVDGILTTSGVTTSGGATLAGIGTINANVTLAGGILSPGNASNGGVGDLIVNGSVSLDSSSLVSITINDEAVGGFDRIVNSGTFDAGSATLSITFNDASFASGTSAADLAAATRYRFVTGPAGASLFGNATLIPAADQSVLGLDGSQYEVTASGQRFWLEKGSWALVPIVPVPEPSGVVLTMLSGLGLVARRRRQG